MQPRALMTEALRRWGPRVSLDRALQQRRRAYLETRFPAQRKLIASRARRRAGFCPRRSGKTGATEGLLLDGALDGADHLVIIVAKTRERAHQLTWKPIARACKVHGIPTKPEPSESETLKSVYVRTFPNGSAIRWVGADNLSALDNKRGDKPRRVVIEEAQDIDPAILESLVKDVFGPSLEDLGGDLILMGTPDEICAGMWFGITATDDELGEDAALRVPGWEVHRWTPADNPHIPRIHARLKSGEIAKECGGPNSPTFLREWRGKWVRDTGGLFYAFDTHRNLFKKGAVVPWGEGWLHVLGWDLGSNDDMAIVVWGWHPAKAKTLYEAFSWKKPGALVDECAAVIKACGQRFTLVARVADTGGGGKMFVEEVQARHHLSFEPAQKTEKHAHVRLFNADLVAGRVQLELGSEYAKEIARLPKVKGWDEAKTGQPAPEDPRFPNHCSDAGLYSWRRAYAFLHEATQERPEADSDEGKALEAAEMKQRRADRLQQRKERQWWEQ